MEMEIRPAPTSPNNNNIAVLNKIDDLSNSKLLKIKN